MSSSRNKARCKPRITGILMSMDMKQTNCRNQSESRLEGEIFPLFHPPSEIDTILAVDVVAENYPRSPLCLCVFVGLNLSIIHIHLFLPQWEIHDRSGTITTMSQTSKCTNARCITASMGLAPVQNCPMLIAGTGLHINEFQI